MAASDEITIPAFIKPEVHLPDGRVFKITKPLNNYRSCHDGTPQEARMVFVCTLSEDNQEYILKVKVQLPATNQTPTDGPSTTTLAETQALEKFTTAACPFTPYLVAFHREKQDSTGPLPTGYITYTIMTKLPGFALFGKYWNMDAKERDEIVPKAVEALRAIYALGIEPTDRGLRNVMWDPVTRYCGIIDFELWNPINGTFGSDKSEMQRWGLLRTPPARDHYIAFNAMYRNG